MFTYEEEECSEAEDEQEWAREVCIVHNTLVDVSQGVQHCERLGSYV